MPVETRSADRVTNYNKFWQKDSAKDNETHRADRLDAYTDLVNGYYDGATELYEYGWGTLISLGSCLLAQPSLFTFAVSTRAKLSCKRYVDSFGGSSWIARPT